MGLGEEAVEEVELVVEDMVDTLEEVRQCPRSRRPKVAGPAVEK